MLHSDLRGLTPALMLSLALHGAVLLMHGHARDRAAAPARVGTYVRLVGRAPALEPVVGALSERKEMQLIPAEPSLSDPTLDDRPAQELAAMLDLGDEGDGSDSGEEGAVGPRFLEDPTVSDPVAERMRGLGDVDLALTVSRDGKVSRIEVLKPQLSREDYAWLTTMIANARITPGMRDGVPIACRWLIRISVPPGGEAATG